MADDEAHGRTEEEPRRILAERIRGPLPGARAHRWMAPRPRPGWDPEADAPPGRPAAVLALLLPAQENEENGGSGGGGSFQESLARLRLLFTERTDAVEWHKGQLSYPGGRIEPGEDEADAARREAEEEIGISRSLPQIVGRLSPLWVPATGFTIQPFVAFAAKRPALRVNPGEVRRIIEVSPARLMDPRTAGQARSMMGGAWVEVPYFDLDGARLWGATAMITAELLALFGWTGPR